MLPTARPAAAPTGVKGAVNSARASSTRVKAAQVNSAPANSSRLVRLLAGITAAQGAPAKLSFAERLGQWLGWADAISLCALLDGGAAGPSGAAPGPSVTAGLGTSPAAALALLQAELAQAIAGDVVFAAGAQPADFLPYRRSHAAQQRAMAARVAVLREQVRAALAQRSAGQRRLAALDQLLDGVVGAQERSILSTVPGWLEKRFAQLRDRQASADAAGVAADSAGDWRAAFGQEMQALLLAELELRLQPVQGLIEALDLSKSP